MSPRNRYVDSHSQVASSTIFAAVRCSSSLGPKRKRSSASSSRPVPATTPYRRPFSSRRACTSKIARIPAVPLRSAPSSIVSSYWSVNNALLGSCGAAVFTDNPGWKPRRQGGEECPVRRIVGPGRETGRVSRFRLYPTPAQETALLGHCAQARFGWDLALEQANSYGTAGRKAPPNFAAQCRQLAEARAEHQWLAAGSQTVQQQARRDLDQAWRNFYGRTHRRP